MRDGARFELCLQEECSEVLGGMYGEGGEGGGTGREWRNEEEGGERWYGNFVQPWLIDIHLMIVTVSI